MKTPTLIAAVIAAALASTPALAAQADNGQLGARLAGANLLAAQMEHVTERHVGSAVPDAVAQRATVIAAQLGAARTLAGGAMDAEIDNVLAALARVTDNGALSDNAPLAAREVAIKTRALLVNADLVQATRHLAKVTEGNGANAAAMLEEARSDLRAAVERGGYHVQNDLDEVGQVIDGLDTAKGGVDPAVIDERIAEITDHMYRFGMTG